MDREPVVAPGFFYMFHNAKTGQALVGSTNNVSRRRREHEVALSQGRHPNQRFQEAFSENSQFAFVSVELPE